MTNILIQPGTIVSRDDGKTVALACIVCVDAERESDGSYSYHCAGHKWYASAGTVRAI